MLELRNISKIYGEVHALKKVNISFRNNEFVSILGPSGCGKTTTLNIIGGLDQATSGELFINQKSTEHFEDKDWDAYRNKSIGFVFQSYNLIPHLSVLENVSIALTLSGKSDKTSKERAEDLLTTVGLKEHFNKKPNQLSGGQMQRVAIARALINDPDIILADEPTGALDSVTSDLIMELLQKVAQDRLVIMVTHNEDIAEKYSSRIIRLLDGEVTGDSNPYNLKGDSNEFLKLSKTSMPFKAALSLSGKNLWAKKGRTILTSFAGSIGIVGISLILALSNGLSSTLNKAQEDTLASSPITIGENTGFVLSEPSNLDIEYEKYPNDSNYIVKEDVEFDIPKSAPITEEYIDYIQDMDEELYSSIQMINEVNMNLITETDAKYELISSKEAGIDPLVDNNEYNLEMYDVLEGKFPESNNELVFVVDKDNGIPEGLSKKLNLDKKGSSFSDLINLEYHYVVNDDYYNEENGIFTEADSENYESFYNDSDTILKVVGVIRSKENAPFEMYGAGIYYPNGLLETVLDSTLNSEIVKRQEEVGNEYSVLGGALFVSESPFASDDELYEEFKTFIGSSKVPSKISIVPKDFENKDEIKSYLNKYNDNKEPEEQILYADLSEIISEVLSTVVNTVSYVLIGFSSISLIVSSIMIGIITYVSVIERTREIGVLRSLGARKKDITRVFNAETFLVGLTSGLMGIFVTYGLSFPINKIVLKLTDTPNIVEMRPDHTLILITLSIILTLLAGIVPAGMASKKDPVVALRSE